jgi:cytochrome c553
MKQFLAIVVLVLLASCQRKTTDYEIITGPLSSEQALEAQKLMVTHCYLCHSPNAPEQEGRIAPPMVAIKAYYQKETDSREDFIQAIMAYTNYPLKAVSKIPGSEERYGKMPYQQFPDGVVEIIAAYLYDYRIQEPEWFASYWQVQHGSWEQKGSELAASEIPKTYDELGLEYALGTKAVLGKNLMGAIKSKGTLAALEFCNIQAIPLTDSMAVQYHAQIKRVSDKNRNPNNKANAEELKYIQHFKELVATQQEPKPVVLENGNKVLFYYPITTNTMCLQCHGKQVTEEVRLQTLKLYPRDLAVGYEENEVRGIWSISFHVSR